MTHKEKKKTPKEENGHDKLDSAGLAFQGLWLRLGQDTRPIFDPIVEAVIQHCGGWEFINDNWTFKERRWHMLQFYKEFSRLDNMMKNGHKLNDIKNGGDYRNGMKQDIKIKNLSALEKCQEEVVEFAKDRKIKGLKPKKLASLCGPDGTIDLTKLSTALTK